MATLISSLVSQARTRLNEPTASFWSDAELLQHAVSGMKDLWGAIIDLHQEHYLTIDESNVSLVADSNALTGVPSNVFRVHTIEVRDMSSSTTRDLTFEPKDWNHPDFVAARSRGSVSPAGETIFFALVGAGAPVAAPTIKTAPRLNAAVDLTLAYNPTLTDTDLESGDNNPVPGESDNAIINWIVAYALGKQREDQQPDSGWLTLYATEKKNVLTRLTPRQTVEPDTAEAMYEEYWGL